MEGQLSMEAADDDASTSPTRRKVLKASAALSATGVVGSGFVGSAAGNHQPCSLSQQCQGTVVWDQGTVGDGCDHCPDAVDSVTVGTVVVPCEFGGWMDAHHRTRTSGPTGDFKAGYPVGASTLLQQGTHTDVCIPLYDCAPAPNGSACLEWNRNNWPRDTGSLECDEMSVMLHQDSPDDDKITHYCEHEGPQQTPDHAYLCDERPNKTGTVPIQTVRTVCGDGKA